MPVRGSRLYWLLCCGGVAILASGCTGDSAESAPPTSVSDRGDVVLALPLSNLVVRSRESEEVVFRRQEALMAQCMEKRGFEYPSSVYQSMPMALFLERPFGVWDLQEAEDRGYHGPVIEPFDDRVSAYVQTLDADVRESYLLNLNGIGSPPPMAEFPGGLPEPSIEGCLQVSVGEMFGDYEDYNRVRLLTQELVAAATESAMADARVQGSLARWRECMKSAGYDIEDPASAAQIQSDEPSNQEREQAVVDVGCKEDADLMRVWYEVKLEFEDALAEANPETLAALQRYRSDEIVESQ